MTDTKFTPGPWEAITDGEVPDVVFNNGKDSIFYVNGEEGNANARLIATAPVLYDALRRLSGDASDYMTGFAGPDAINAAIRDADAALRKARGEASDGEAK